MKARHKDTGEIIELAEEGIISCDGRRFCWHQVELIPEPIDEFKPSSLPSNLDEAADAYSENILANGEDMFDAIADGFRAGAEWMAGQGVTKEAVIGMATEEISINVFQQTLDELDLCPGDKVVVQIRKAK